MPLPTAEIQAFARPSVKDGVLTQPVTIAGETHGFSAPVSAWRDMAWQILGITPGRRTRSAPLGEKKPIVKPSGGIL